MSKHLTEVIVGLAFVFGVGVLGAYTILVSGLSFGKTKTYVVDFDRVYGLKEGDGVRVDGFEKGEVKSLRLVRNEKGEERVRVLLMVSADVRIYRQGSEVRVTPFSPLGGRVIEITRGKEGERGEYTFLADAGGVGQDEVDIIEGKAEGELLQTLNALVEENRSSIKRIVDNVEKVSVQLTRTDNVLGYLINDEGGAQKLRSVATHLSNSAETLDGILSEVKSGKGVVGGLVVADTQLDKDVRATLGHARGAADSLEQILARADKGQSGLGVLVSEDEQVRGAVKGVITDVKTVTGKVAKGEGTLGKLVHDERLYEGAAKTAENLKSITAKVDSGKGLLGVLLEEEAGNNTRKAIKHIANITEAVDDPEAGTLGLLVHDDKLRSRIVRVTEQIEGLVTEFRDSLEDVREQAPVNAFIGAVFAAF